MNRIAGKSAGIALLMVAALLAALFAAGVFSPGSVGAHGGGDDAHGGGSAGTAGLDKLVAMVGEAAASPPAGGTQPSKLSGLEIPDGTTHVTFYFSWVEGSRNVVTVPSVASNVFTTSDNWYNGVQDFLNNTRVFRYVSSGSGWTKTEVEKSKDYATRSADGSIWDGTESEGRITHSDVIGLEFKLKAGRYLPRVIGIKATDKDSVPRNGTPPPEHTLKDAQHAVYLLPPDRMLPSIGSGSFLDPALNSLHYVNDVDDREAGSAQKLTLKATLAASDEDEITIDFAGFGVPASIAPSDVTLIAYTDINAGSTEEASPGAVEVNGTTVTLTFRTRTGTGAATGIENALSASKLTDIIFSSGSGITLPKQAGLYPVSVRSEDTAANHTSFANFAEVVRSVAASPGKGTLRNTAITFTGKGFNGETVTVTVGDKTLGTATVEDGVFTLDVPSDPRDSNGGRVFTPGENMIKAKESDGEAEVMFNMKNLSPPVRNLKVTPAEGGTTATVSWRKSKPADDKEHRCPSATQRQYRYKVVLWEPGGNVDRTEVVDHTNTSDTTVNLTGLAPGTEYAVLVWSRSDECNNWSKFRRKIWTQPGG